MSYSVLMSWHLQLINHILNNYWWLHLIYPLATGQHTHLLPELFFAESLNFNKIAFIKLVLYVEPSLGPYSCILVCAFWNSNKLASEATHAYEVHMILKHLTYEPYGQRGSVIQLNMFPISSWRHNHQCHQYSRPASDIPKTANKGFNQ